MTRHGETYLPMIDNSETSVTTFTGFCLCGAASCDFMRGMMSILCINLLIEYAQTFQTISIYFYTLFANYHSHVVNILTLIVIHTKNVRTEV